MQQSRRGKGVYECQIASSMFLFALVNQDSQWHSIANAVLLWPVLLWLVSANQLSELFAGFCIGWVTCLEGKLKFALQNATPPTLSYV